ncbi:MAG: hypothetical protein RIB97_10045 [Nitratireductor sp.]
MRTGSPWRAVEARLYAGEILVFRGLAAVASLRDYADAQIREAFPGGPPEKVTDRLPRERFVAEMAALRQRWGADEEAARLWRSALDACGCDLTRTYWDRHRLRVNPPGRTHHSRRILNLPAHRDSWGSMAPQQINWWAPIYPLSEGRTLLIYPDAWNRPVANDSAQWDLLELKRLRAAGGPVDYPLLPSATDPAEWGAPLALTPEPGDIVAFSAAHLHASAPNGTGLSRFNVEGRTIDADAYAAGRGAPDPDGAAPRRALHWFSHCLDGRPLGPEPLP